MFYRAIKPRQLGFFPSPEQHSEDISLPCGVQNRQPAGAVHLSRSGSHAHIPEPHHQSLVLTTQNSLYKINKWTSGSSQRVGEQLRSKSDPSHCEEPESRDFGRVCQLPIQLFLEVLPSLAGYKYDFSCRPGCGRWSRETLRAASAPKHPEQISLIAANYKPYKSSPSPFQMLRKGSPEAWCCCFLKRPRLLFCSAQRENKESRSPRSGAVDLPVVTDSIRNIKSMWEKGNVFNSPGGGGSPFKVRRSWMVILIFIN